MENANQKTRTIVFTAACIALCVVLPFAFHVIPNGGSIFSPMHIPVLLCGLIAGPFYGLLCGLIGPFLSSLITGMPPFGRLPAMMAELAVYGLVSGLVMKKVHLDKLRTDLYLSLITAMLSGRIAGGIVAALLYTKGKYSLPIWAAAYFGNSLPGIVLQLILIPILYVALEAARFIPKRYPSARVREAA